MGAIQWMAFFIAASIAVPIAIAQAFELNYRAVSGADSKYILFTWSCGDGANV
ncbi:hypothetical protein ACEQPO_28170 [Bacillus sp. SL00103]